MTPQETAKQQAEVMIAFAEGKTIQSTRCSDREIKWEDQPSPLWDWIHFEYRIKPQEPKKVTLLGHVDEFKYARYALLEFKGPNLWTRVRALDLGYEATE